MKDTFAKRMRQAMATLDMKQIELADKTGLNRSAINQYYTGKYEPKQKGIYLIAKALEVNEAWLMGYEVPMEKENINCEIKKIKLIGQIVEGNPFFEDPVDYVELTKNLKADYCIRMSDDTMTYSNIKKGDILFVQKSDHVIEGSIMALIVNNDILVRRIYKEMDMYGLIATNPEYKPLVLKKEAFKVIGRCIAVQASLI